MIYLKAYQQNIKKILICMKFFYKLIVNIEGVIIIIFLIFFIISPRSGKAGWGLGKLSFEFCKGLLNIQTLNMMFNINKIFWEYVLNGSGRGT